MTATRVIAKAILVADDGQMLLLRRSQTAPRRPLEWDLPGGLVEDGESFVAAASREIAEETGLRISEADLHLVYTSSHMWDEVNICRLFFVGHSPSVEVALSHEHDQFQWLPVSEAIAAIKYPVQEEVLRYIVDNQLL